MKIGDLVTFCPEAWGTPLEDRPLGVIVNVDDLCETYQLVTVRFARDEIPYSTRSTDLEVVNENW